MALSKYRIGQLIKIVDERNSFDINDFYGININKEFMPTVANTEGLDETNYKIVRKNRFVFSGMQTGRDKCIRISMYMGNEPIIVSPAYTTFEIVDEYVLPTYFFMIFLSQERDRLGWFYSDGSIRSNLDWDRFCDIQLNIPDLPTQQKYVDIYNAMVANQQAYERGLEDLKTVFTSYIEELRRNDPVFPIGDYITLYNEKNGDGAIALEQGININKEFISPQRSNSNLQGRKIVRHGQFAYCTQLNNANVAIAYRSGKDCVVSSVYDVFEITQKDKLIPEYLLMWLIRPEFGRYVYWASEGSAYEFLNYNNLASYKIPIPNIEVQRAIAEIYTVYNKRKKINEQLKAQIKNICPILIKGSLEEN
jgi:type I restriction enzyme S subunit